MSFDQRSAVRGRDVVKDNNALLEQRPIECFIADLRKFLIRFSLSATILILCLLDTTHNIFRTSADIAVIGMARSGSLQNKAG